MANKNAKSEGGAVSTAEPQEQTNETAIATRTQNAALQQTGDGDVSGPLAIALSQEMQDSLALELREALSQVEQGFGNLTAPGEIFKRAQPFHVVDAFTINDYVDSNTGEEKVKHIFKLQFDDGTVALTMQSDARPRRILAKAFTNARALGARLTCGPFLYEQKTIPRQIQPAYIFAQQSGFEARTY